LGVTSHRATLRRRHAPARLPHKTDKSCTAARFPLGGVTPVEASRLVARICD
jgi:hypothetical protein